MSNTDTIYRLKGTEGTAAYVAETILRRNGWTGEIPAALLADTIAEVEYHGDARPPARSIPEGWTKGEVAGTEVWSHPDKRKQVIKTEGFRPCRHPECEKVHGKGPFHTVRVSTRWFLGTIDAQGYLDADEVDSRVDGFWRAR